VNVIVLQVFVSLMLVASSVALFVFTVRSRTLEHADRLSLTPLEDDAPRGALAEAPLLRPPQSPAPSPVPAPGDR
jgi:hypothetical protein